MADQLLNATAQQLVVAINNLSLKLTAVLPVITATATSATAGTNGAVPAQVAKYFIVTDPTTGTSFKCPVFNL